MPFYIYAFEKKTYKFGGYSQELQSEGPDASLPMKIERIRHSSGNVLPIVLDDDGLPLPEPNEWILGQRGLAENSLDRLLRELIPLLRWAKKNNIDIYDRIERGSGFSEAIVKGGIVEALRRDQSRRRITKMTVSPKVFDSRITTVSNFFRWFTDTTLAALPRDDPRYETIRNHHDRLAGWLTDSLVNLAGGTGGKRRGLTAEQRDALITRIQVLRGSAKGFGHSEAICFRNYVAAMLMLLCGLRRGELLCLRVEDVQIGAISSVSVVRRPDDPDDPRGRRPHVKRGGRILPLDGDVASIVDAYIRLREDLVGQAPFDHPYLIVSDEGTPLSLNRLNAIFVELRTAFPDALPPDLTPHLLRYSFSEDLERKLRASGMEENNRAKALALLRGDSSLDSQAPYIARAIEEQANSVLRRYQSELLQRARSLDDVPY